MLHEAAASAASWWGCSCIEPAPCDCPVCCWANQPLPQVDDGWSSPVPDWHSAASATSNSAGTTLLEPAALGSLVGEGVDLGALQHLAATAATPLPAAGVVSPRGPAPRSFRAALGVARDEAFCRYYQQ
jgi:hypothetical protein